MSDTKVVNNGVSGPKGTKILGTQVLSEEESKKRAELAKNGKEIRVGSYVTSDEHKLGEGGQASTYKAVMDFDTFLKRYEFDPERDDYIRGLKTGQWIIESQNATDGEARLLLRNIGMALDEGLSKALANAEKEQDTIRKHELASLAIDYSEILGIDRREAEAELRWIVENTPVALKVMEGVPGHADHKTFQTLGLSGISDIGRFADEYKHLRNLTHTNVPHPIMWENDEGFCYMAMELMKGDLIGHLGDRAMDPTDEFYEMVFQITKTLKAIHARQLVHRDLKPENILVGFDGVAHVADLGVAKDPNRFTVTKQDRGGPGTLLYIPPEQLRKADVDHRSDQYAFGGLTIYILTGRVPRENILNGSIEAAEEFILSQWEPVVTPRERNSNVSRGLENAILKMMHPDPAERYADMNELENDLWRVRRGQDPIAPDRSREMWSIHFSLPYKLRGVNRHQIPTGERLDIDWMDDEVVIPHLKEIRELIYLTKVTNMVDAIPDGHFPDLSSSKDNPRYNTQTTPHSFAGNYVALLLRGFEVIGDGDFQERALSLMDKIMQPGYQPNEGCALAKILTNSLVLASQLSGRSDHWTSSMREQWRDYSVQAMERLKDTNWVEWGNPRKGGPLDYARALWYRIRGIENKGMFNFSEKVKGDSYAQNYAQVVPLLILAAQQDREYARILDVFTKTTIEANVEDGKVIPDRAFIDDGTFTEKKFIRGFNFNDHIYNTPSQTSMALAVLEVYEFNKDPKLLELGELLMKTYEEGLRDDRMPRSPLFSNNPEYRDVFQMDAGILAMRAWRKLHRHTGNEEYKLLERMTLAKVLFDGMDTRPDSHTLIYNCSTSIRNKNVARIEAFSDFMGYLDDVIGG